MQVKEFDNMKMSLIENFVINADESNKTRIQNKLGYIEDVPDTRDYIYEAPPVKQIIRPRFRFSSNPQPRFRPVPPPLKFSLQTKLPQVLDQGDLGSCVSNAVSNILKYIDMKNNRPNRVGLYSRLFNYYNTRVLENSVYSDDGCQIRNAIKVINKIGSTDEIIWPYVILKFKDKPSQTAYSDATTKKITKYRRVNQTNTDIKSCIQSGYPVIVGFLCFSSMFTFNVFNTGNIPMPRKNEQIYGGHCVILVGYNDSTRTYEFQNSWGTSWGNKGFGTIPYTFIENPNYATDFWMVENTI